MVHALLRHPQREVKLHEAGFAALIDLLIFTFEKPQLFKPSFFDEVS